MSRTSAQPACETRCKRAGLALALLWCAVIVLAGPAAPVPAHAQEPAAGQPAPPDRAGAPAAHAANNEAPAEGHGEAQEEESPWGLIGKIVNFVILAGTIYYFARAPFARYLGDRSAQIRDDLDRAAEVKEDANRQIADIQAKLQQLPAELDTLRARGRDEVAAEEARINETAASERDRLLEQTRREIDAQLRTARRDLVTHAADLSVQVARERIRDRITSEDQARLVDRYLSQVKSNG